MNVNQPLRTLPLLLYGLPMFKRFALGLAATCVSTSAFARGAEGHRIVAAIAADELTPAASKQVAMLLGADAKAQMIEVSSWADEIRTKQRNTASWHFVDVPIGSDGYSATRDCKRDNCVVAQIEKDAEVVADRSRSQDDRAEALRFLIHFVGDIHQPLHAANNHDSGGNGLRVDLRGRHTNMHSVWDSDVVRALGRSELAITSNLDHDISPAKSKGWQHGSAADWANESFTIAAMQIYATLPGPDLPDNYARSDHRRPD